MSSSLLSNLYSEVSVVAGVEGVITHTGGGVHTSMGIWIDLKRPQTNWCPTAHLPPPQPSLACSLPSCCQNRVRRHAHVTVNCRHLSIECTPPPQVLPSDQIQKGMGALVESLIGQAFLPVACATPTPHLSYPRPPHVYPPPLPNTGVAV
jgi:hypothetical protein